MGTRRWLLFGVIALVATGLTSLTHAVGPPGHANSELAARAPSGEETSSPLSTPVGLALAAAVGAVLIRYAPRLSPWVAYIVTLCIGIADEIIALVRRGWFYSAWLKIRARLPAWMR
ncbi:MAG: hypothetical protein FJX74_21885 [Armatimonadetes bacterium]|nr:hypothetical protein [Armatimonadota bacterium]